MVDPLNKKYIQVYDGYSCDREEKDAVTLATKFSNAKLTVLCTFLVVISFGMLLMMYKNIWHMSLMSEKLKNSLHDMEEAHAHVRWMINRLKHAQNVSHLPEMLSMKTDHV